MRFLIRSVVGGRLKSAEVNSFGVNDISVFVSKVRIHFPGITRVGFVHMYERCYLVTRDVFYTSRSTEAALQNLFGCNRRNRIAQEIRSELLYFS